MRGLTNERKRMRREKRRRNNQNQKENQDNERIESLRRMKSQTRVREKLILTRKDMFKSLVRRGVEEPEKDLLPTSKDDDLKYFV